MSLREVSDVVPLSDGSESDVYSFSLVLPARNVHVVAPTQLDFHVWYYGLSFLVRLYKVTSTADSVDRASTKQ